MLMYAVIELLSLLEKKCIFASLYDQIYLPSFVYLFPVLLQWFSNCCIFNVLITDKFCILGWQIKNAIFSAERSVKEFVFGQKNKGSQEGDGRKLESSTTEKQP